MSEERKLGVGIIGCGGVANFAHIPNYQRNPRARVVAVADVDLERAKSTAERWGIDAYYQDYRELLGRPDVEAVSVTSWVAAHAEAVIAAARAGKHIICEKPIATRLEDADAMVAAAEAAGVKFTMGYQSRFSNSWQTLKRLLDEGTIGQIRALNIVSCAKNRLPATWFYKKETAGGGVLMDWGIYTAYMINWLMGPVESVYGTMAIYQKEDKAGFRYNPEGTLVTDIDVEDTVAATLKFKSGAMGTWYTTWLGPAQHGYTAIDGSAGSIVMRGRSEELSVFTTTVDEPDLLRGWRQLRVTEPPLADLHYRKLEHLVNAVLDDQPLVMTGADGRDALELVLAIYQSAEIGQPVRLPLPRG